MDDAASLRARVHGVTAAAPKTWDESKSKGYDPNYTFDESKVKRDTDPGEEGRFDKKGGSKGKLSDAEKKRRSFARWYAKQPKEVKEFLTWLNKQPKNVKDWFIQLSKMTAAQRRAMLGLDNLPDVKEMRNGRINLRQNLSPEDRAAVERSESTGEDGAGNPLPQPDKPKLQEDEVPLKSPSGAKLVDFSGGVGHYSDGSTFDKDGWHKPMQASADLSRRREAAIKGHALPDGSYPIVTEADWRKAMVACAASPRAVVVEHIRRRGQALGVQGLTASVNALTAAMPNGLGRWDPDLHPRGRDGKFIESLGFVSGLFKWERKAPSENTRAQVLGFAENKSDPDDPFVVVQGKGKERGYAKASEVAQVAAPKGDLNVEGELLPSDEEMDAQIDAEMAVELAADERDYNDRNEGTAGFERSRDFTQDDEYEQSKEVKPKQLTLADAPTVGPPGTRPDLGTPGMSIKQNIALVEELTSDKRRAELLEDGNDEADIDQMFTDIRSLEAADVRKYEDLREDGATHEEAFAEVGGEDRFANSPDEMYEGLYDQPDDLEQFPEAAETPRLDADVAPAQPPTATRGQFTYSFDEGNWANAEVWRWNSETGEGEMIGRAHIVAGDKAQFVPNGAGKPFPRTFDNAQELLEVAAETDKPAGDTKLGADPVGAPKPKGFGIGGPKVGQKVQVKPGMPDEGKTGTVSKVEKYSIYVDYDDGTTGTFAKGTGIMPASTKLGAEPQGGDRPSGHNSDFTSDQMMALEDEYSDLAISLNPTDSQQARMREIREQTGRSHESLLGKEPNEFEDADDTKLGADPASTDLPITSKREKLDGGWFLEHPSQIKSGWRITHPDFGELPPWKTEDEARAEHARKISGDTKLGAEPDMMHLDEGRFDAQQERGAGMTPFESEDEREKKRAELRERVKHMSAKTPVDELAEMREKLRQRVHQKAS